MCDDVRMSEYGRLWEDAPKGVFDTAYNMPHLFETDHDDGSRRRNGTRSGP